MSIKSVLRKSKKNLFVLLAWNEYRRFVGNVQKKRISDYEFIVDTYNNRTGKKLQLKCPKRFTEQLQWLKLFYRDSRIEICSDKYTVRNYLKEQGYQHLLNDLIAVYDSVEEIDLNVLPEKFVLKASHGSGWNIICKDKKKIHWGIYKFIVKSWMKQNLYIYGREWNYENLTPKIIVEKYIDSGDNQLTDYKFFCFSGTPEFVQVDRDRFKKHKQTYYDMNWVQLPFSTGHMSEPEACPPMFEKMKEIAATLSAPFPHVRIDFYNVGDRVYFGEFTYFDGSGFYNFEPDCWDYYWGEKMKLPCPNHNIDLYKKLYKCGEN